MDDDFNTPQALAALFDLARLLYTERDRVVQGAAGAGGFATGVEELVTLARVLGLLERPGREHLAIDPVLQTRIESLVAQRGDARRRRDFAEADRLREELHRMGVVVEDTPGGTSWKVRS